MKSLGLMHNVYKWIELLPGYQINHWTHSLTVSIVSCNKYYIKYCVNWLPVIMCYGSVMSSTIKEYHALVLGLLLNKKKIEINIFHKSMTSYVPSQDRRVSNIFCSLAVRRPNINYWVWPMGAFLSSDWSIITQSWPLGGSRHILLFSLGDDNRPGHGKLHLVSGLGLLESQCWLLAGQVSKEIYIKKFNLKNNLSL